MKKVLLFFITSMLTLSIASAGEQYQQKMAETISLFKTNQSVEGIQDLANRFRVIGQAEKSEWLPVYYEAYCYILLSFIDQSSAEKRDGYLDVAKSSSDRLMELAPTESEAVTLLAFYHTARMVVNPPERAQKSAPLSGSTIGKALGLEPENPRAMYLKLSNEMGTARYFGSDQTSICQQSVALLERWDSYTPKSPIHPAWGRNLVEQMVENCGQESGE